ncbi:MAG: hypothetical protein B6D36_12065, partial [Planctomycetes bacterium UTPLA1]
MIVTNTIRNFGKVGDAMPIPNLIAIQVDSYKRFLQAEIPPEQRTPTGLEGLLREVFPITSYDENIHLEYLDYSLGKPRYTPDECRQLRLTYGMPLRVHVKLHRRDKDEMFEDRIYLGDIPIMIGGGEFIINGAERVIVSQLHRSPGVDFIKETLEADRPLHACRIIPERGSWIEINITRKDVMAVRIDQSSKIPATCFLRAMDSKYGTDEAIIKLFYQTKTVRTGSLKADMFVVSDVWPDDMADVTEPLVRAGCQIGDALGKIQGGSLKQLEVVEKVGDPLILNTLTEDNCHSHEDALMRIYKSLRPGNPAQLDKAVKLFHEKFYDQNRYRLGRVGRFRINRKFGLALPTSLNTLTAADFIACLRYLLDLRSQERVGFSVPQRLPFELCLLRWTRELGEQLNGYQSKGQHVKDPKEGVVLGQLDSIRDGRKKLQPSDVVTEMARQLRSLSDAPTEWIPVASLDMEKMRGVLGRTKTDRDSEVNKLSRDFIVATIRTRASRLLEGIDAYQSHEKLTHPDLAQIDFLNYYLHPGALYTFSEAESKKKSEAADATIEAEWKELFGAGCKHVAFDTFENTSGILTKHGQADLLSVGNVHEYGWRSTRVIVQEDDIDHLGNRRLRTIDELACDEIRKGFLKLRRTVQERMSMRDPDQLGKIAELINSKAISGAIEFFFGRGELSQVVDQTNPLSQLTHERRLSALGPGGLNRKRAGFEVRDVHISHYGRICPIETPEGTNIGLIASLSIYSTVDEYGFLITPYRKVDKGGSVNGGYEFLRADEEMKTVLAPPEAVDPKTSKVTGVHIMARIRGDLAMVENKDIEYIDISPKQTVGVSASLIPFLEHDDANRASMGSNMQRQAVPPLLTEPPVVATGM